MTAGVHLPIIVVSVVIAVVVLTLILFTYRSVHLWIMTLFWLFNVLHFTI